MKRRIRRPGPDGRDIVADLDLGPGAVTRPVNYHNNPVPLSEAIPPKKEHLMFINQDSASKYAPGESPAFNGPITS